MSYDTLLTYLGEFGPYHIRIFFMLSVLPIFNAFHACSIIFNNIEPDFRCAVPDYSNDTFNIQTDFHYRVVNTSVVFDKDKNRFSHCSIYNDASDGINETLRVGNRSTDKCDVWVFEKKQARASIVAEMDLVCDRKSYRTHANMFIMSGFLVGSLFGGALVDYFGRKKILIIAVFTQGLIGVGFAFITSVALMFLGRFLLATLSLVNFIAIFVHLAEIVGPKRRTVATMGTMFGWCVGLFLVDFVYYFVTDWRIAQIVISAPALLVISYWWLLPESPRWLLLHNRMDEAKAIISKMADVNKVTLPDDIGAILLEDMDDAEKKVRDEPEKGKPWHLFTSKIMFLRIVILSFSWCTNSMVYYGMTLNIGDLIEGNVFVNFALQAGMELIAYIICVIILEKVGRKKIYSSFILTSGFACVAMCGPLIAQTKIRWIEVTLFSIGKLGITGSFAVIFIFTAELFPTGVRNFGLGFCSFVGRIGGILSPYIAGLGFIIPSSFGQTLPLLIFGLCSIIAGVTSLTLPETKDQQLPDTMAEAEVISKSTRKSQMTESEISI